MKENGHAPLEASTPSVRVTSSRAFLRSTTIFPFAVVQFELLLTVASFSSIPCATANAIVTDQDGNAYIAGRWRSSDSYSRGSFIAKFSAEHGEKMWEKSFDTLSIIGLSVGRNGRIICACGSTLVSKGPPTKRGILSCLETNGSFIASRTLEGRSSSPFDEELAAVAFDLSNNSRMLFAAGSCGNNGAVYQFSLGDHALPPGSNAGPSTLLTLENFGILATGGQVAHIAVSPSMNGTFYVAGGCHLHRVTAGKSHDAEMEYSSKEVTSGSGGCDGVVRSIVARTRGDSLVALFEGASNPLLLKYRIRDAELIATSGRGLRTSNEPTGLVLVGNSRAIVIGAEQAGSKESRVFVSDAVLRQAVVGADQTAPGVSSGAAETSGTISTTTPGIVTTTTLKTALIAPTAGTTTSANNGLTASTIPPTAVVAVTTTTMANSTANTTLVTTISLTSSVTKPLSSNYYLVKYLALGGGAGVILGALLITYVVVLHTKRTGEPA
jgi:hypothetical protein